MAVRKEKLLVAAAVVAIVVIQLLLLLGFVYGILSPRQWAVGLLIWFAVLLLWVLFRRMTQRKSLVSSGEPHPPLDERARKRILRMIWRTKVWIGMLAVLFPLGIAYGIAQRVWLPTIVGGAISLLWMYVSIQEIRRQRKRLSLS